MVASLQDTSLEEECFTQALQQQQESRNTAAALPLSHEAAMKWFYKDPQGEIQGTLSHCGIYSHLHAHTCTHSILVHNSGFLNSSPSLYPTHYQVHSPLWRCASGSRLVTSPWPCWWSGAATRASNPWGTSSRCGAACPSPQGPPRRPCWWDSHHQRSARSPPGGPPGLWVRAQPT